VIPRKPFSNLCCNSEREIFSPAKRPFVLDSTSLNAYYDFNKGLLTARLAGEKARLASKTVKGSSVNYGRERIYTPSSA
jgi:hypothetical protein